MEKDDWIELEAIGINYAEKRNFFTKLLNRSSSYILILVNKANKNARLQLLINQLEGQGIAIALEKMTPSRPLIQDLFKTTVEIFNSKLEYIVIDEYDHEGYLHSSMKFADQNKIVKSRPADAIAMALRFECPIYISKEIFKKLSIVA